MRIQPLINLTAATALLLGMYACNVETQDFASLDPTPEQPGTETPGEYTTIQARLGSTPGETRTIHTYDNGTIKVAWTMGATGKRDDALMVYAYDEMRIPIGKGEIFTISSIAPDGTATFRGKLPQVTGATGYFANYPAHRFPVKADDYNRLLLGQVQQGDNDLNHLEEFNMLIGEFNDPTGSFVMGHQTTVLRLTLNHPDNGFEGYTPVSVTLSNHGDNNNMYVGGDDNGPNKHKSITLGLEGLSAVGVASTTTAYLTMEIGFFKENIHVNVQYRNGDETKTATGTILVTSDRSVYPGQVYDIPAITLTPTTSILDDGTQASTTQFATLDGINPVSATNPYLIQNAADLLQLAKLVDDRNLPEGTYLRLTTDIHVTANKWVPIGANYTFYKCTFDGGGHTISGKLVKGSESYNNGFGFFGGINVSEVRNLHVAADVITTDGNRVGGIAGDVHTGSLINSCTMTGNISARYNGEYELSVGGITGRVLSNGAVQLSGCTFSGVILAENSATSAGSDKRVNAGGISGQITDSRVSITHCVVRGIIEALSAEESIYAGGITGSTLGTLTDCRNYSKISVTGAVKAVYAGGIVGSPGTVVKNCYNSGEVSVTGGSSAADNKSCIGGISGYQPSNTQGCLNEGTVSATGLKDVHIGGIAGGNTVALDGYTLSDCRNRGAVKAKDATTVNIGGLVGYSVGTIHTSHNETTDLDVTNAGTVYKGTLVGAYNSMTVYSCCTSVGISGWKLAGSYNNTLPDCEEGH